MGIANGSLRSGRFRPSGMALITTLMIVSVIVIFLAGFLQLNRTQVSILQVSSQRESLQRGCLSVSQFIQSRLEHDAIWPARDLLGGTANARQEQVVVITNITLSDTPHTSGYSAIIEGNYIPEQVAFEATLTNNLTGAAQLVLPAGRSRALPPESARIAVRCWKAGATNLGSTQVESQTFNFRRAAHIDSTMVASNGILIDSENVIFDSADEVRNQIRSLRDVIFSGLVGLGFDGQMEAAPGVVWARQQILVGDRPIKEALADLRPPPATVREIYTDEVDENGDPIRTTETIRGRDLPIGQFMENAVGDFSMPEFSIEDIREVAEQHDRALAASGSGDTRPLVTLEPGVYEFSRATAVRYDSGDPVYENRQLVAQVSNVVVHRESADPDSRVLAVYVPKNQVYDEFRFASEYLNNEVQGKLVLLDGDQLDENYALPTSGTGDPPILNMRDRTLTLPPTSRFQVNGNFGVAANLMSDESGDEGLALGANDRPQLILAGHEHSNARAYLEASGSVEINGAVQGSGTIVAGKDINIEITRESRLVALGNELDANGDPTGTQVATRASFALFAGDSINVNGDFEQSNLSLAGLIYARNNVLLDFAEEKANALNFEDLRTNFTSEHQGSFHLEGAVVAQNGYLAVRGLKNARFTYNPKYVGDLFASSENQMRLEPLSWWPY